MEIGYSHSFRKDHRKLSFKLRQRLEGRLSLFQENPFSPILNNHSVNYPYEGCQSINISGDFRALYEPRGDLAYFIRVGSHSELYK